MRTYQVTKPAARLIYARLRVVSAARILTLLAVLLVLAGIFLRAAQAAEGIAITSAEQILITDKSFSGKKLVCLFAAEAGHRAGYLKDVEPLQQWFSFDPVFKKKIKQNPEKAQKYKRKRRDFRRLCDEATPFDSEGEPTPSPTASATATPTTVATPCAAGSYVEPQPGFKLNGKERSFRLYVPGCYKDDAQTPLVIFIHGLCGEADKHEAITGLTSAAERYGVLLAYAESSYKPGTIPPGCPVDADGNPKWWGVGPQTAEEIEYLRTLIANVSVSHSIDAARIYLIGHSNGGHMVYQAALAMSEEIAAAAAFAGAPFVKGYTPARKVPFALVQGTADQVVDPSLTTGYRDQIKAVNNATVQNTFAERGAGDMFDEILYSPETALSGALVLWFLIEGMGHLDWPSPDSTFMPFIITDQKSGVVIDINSRVLDFLLLHQLNNTTL